MTVTAEVTCAVRPYFPALVPFCSLRTLRRLATGVTRTPPACSNRPGPEFVEESCIEFFENHDENILAELCDGSWVNSNKYYVGNIKYVPWPDAEICKASCDAAGFHYGGPC